MDPQDGKCWVAKASSIRSQLFSTSDIQSVMKKALVDKMKIEYDTGCDTLRQERIILFGFFIKKDIVTVGLDTTGNSLHREDIVQVPQRLQLVKRWQQR